MIGTWEKAGTINFSDWQPLTKKKKKRDVLDENKVYFRARRAKSGTLAICISIGKQIIARLGWQHGQRIEVMRAKNNPMQYLVFAEPSGNKLSMPDQASVGSISASTDCKDVRVPLDATLCVDHVQRGNYLLIDSGKPDLMGFDRLSQ